MVYYSFSQVAKYVAIGDSYKAKSERRLMKIVGKLKIMVILMICNDLLFSSIRCLLHYNLNTYKESNMAIQYYVLSIITTCFICYDLISITMNISDNKILNKLEEKIRVVDMLLSTKEKYEKDLAEGKINEDGTPKKDRFEQAQEDKKKEKEKERLLKKRRTVRYQQAQDINSSSFLGVNDNETIHQANEDEIFEIEEKDKEEQKSNFTNFKNLEKENKFSADFEFCAKGIKPNQLVIVKKSRYFNIILVIKVSLFEAIIISNQQIPVVQCTFVFLIQGIFIIYLGVCIFKDKIFQDSFSSYKRVLFEIALTVYYFFCMLQGWCQAGLTSLCTPVYLRRSMFFFLLAVMLLLMLIYFIYTLYLAYLRVYYPKLLDKRNRIVLPEEVVKINWIDDSELIGIILLFKLLFNS